jgi:hypothetical protein
VKRTIDVWKLSYRLDWCVSFAVLSDDPISDAGCNDARERSGALFEQRFQDASRKVSRSCVRGPEGTSLTLHGTLGASTDVAATCISRELAVPTVPSSKQDCLLRGGLQPHEANEA